MGSINTKKPLSTDTKQHRLWILATSRKKITGTPRIKPGATEWEAWMLPLCYAPGQIFGPKPFFLVRSHSLFAVHSLSGAENRTRGSWMRSVNATSALAWNLHCTRIFLSWMFRAFSTAVIASSMDGSLRRSSQSCVTGSWRRSSQRGVTGERGSSPDAARDRSE